MIYTTPEVSILGSVRSVIEELSNKTSGRLEWPPHVPQQPAYDLDD